MTTRQRLSESGEEKESAMESDTSDKGRQGAYLGALLLVLALLGAPLAEAQSAGKVPRIGFMAPGSGPIHVEAAFLRGLRENGWVEGQNIAIEWRFAAGNMVRFTEFAAEFVRLNVDLIVAGSTNAAAAAQTATKTIPIVMVGVSTPVEAGYVASLARPGGNITGMALMGQTLNAKRLQLLREAAPKASRVAVLRRPDHPLQDYGLRVLEEAARALGVQLSVHDVHGSGDYDAAFAAMASSRAQALFLQGHPMFLVERKQLAELAMRHRLPSIGNTGEFAEAGGLLGYADDVSETARRAAVFVDRILKGAKPADLPVELPTRFQLVINMKTAKALRLPIPRSLQLQADQVID